MREIPSLQVLCLRAVGGHACSPEDTFAETSQKQPSTASRLLRSFHRRSPNNDDDNHKDNDKVIASIPVKRTPAIGKGSARRKQANDVDLNHPWIAVRKDEGAPLYMESGSSALDVLQSLVDSLVELGRMDDTRLGLHYFQEWKANVAAVEQKGAEKTTTLTPNKRRRISPTTTEPPPLGSLSLHNAIIMGETIEAMVQSKMTANLAVLDLTGIQTLNDELLKQILTTAPHLRRLSVKNCRRLTNKSLITLSENSTKLYSLDIGGSYNLKINAVLEMIANLSQLMELHASGLGWTDESVQELTSLRSWKALSLGFSSFLTAGGFKKALLNVSHSLLSLALPFCEHLVDAALLGYMGRNLPHVRALDMRGNSNLTSLTGWYDGRATIVPTVPNQPLVVLARYSGVSKSSLEDTKRIHPLEATQLNCILDSGGVGTGIQRTDCEGGTQSYL